MWNCNERRVVFEHNFGLLNVEKPWFYFAHFRDAPEATGDEPEDADFDAPKIYEPVSVN